MDLSAIIPCWNAAPYAVRAIISAINYGIRLENIIVVYDGKDQSLKMDSGLFIGVRFITLIENIGLPSVRNYALGLVETKYVVFLDCDDYIIHRSSFLEGSDEDIVFGSWRYSGKLYESTSKDFCDSESDPVRLLGNWFDRAYFPVHALIWRNEFLTKLRRFDPSLKKNEDGELMSRALLSSPKFAFTGSHLALYYQRGGHRVSSASWEEKTKGFSIINKNILEHKKYGSISEFEGSNLLARNKARQFVDGLLYFREKIDFGRLHFIATCLKSRRINLERVLLAVLFGGSVARLPRAFKLFITHPFWFAERLLSRNKYVGDFVRRRFDGMRSKFYNRRDIRDLVSIEPSLSRYEGLFSIAHGIDFFHTREPYDSDEIAPIYLLSNKERLTEIATKKNFFVMPHISVLSEDRFSVDLDNSDEIEDPPELLVLPPMGPQNRLRLVEYLRKKGLSHCVLMVKPRADFDSDRIFLEKSGFRCISLIPKDDEAYYPQMFRFIANFKKIHFLTISSLAFFAAYKGADIEFHRGFYYKFVDIYGYEEKIDFSSQKAVAIARALILGDKASRKIVADDILGANIPYLAGSLSAFMDDQAPFGFNSFFFSGRKFQLIRRVVALITGRSFFLRKDGLKGLFMKVEVELSEIDCWLTGTDGNYYTKHRIDLFGKLRLGGI